MISILHEKIEDAETLADDLDELCTDHRSLLTQTGIRDEMEALMAWAGDYNQVERGLRYNAPMPDKVSRLGGSWIEELRDRLQAEADDVTRWESEGGSVTAPITLAPLTEANELVVAARQLSYIAQRVETLFGHRMTASDLLPEV